MCLGSDFQRTFPRGQAVEVIDSAIFRTAYPLMNSASEREHVTQYFYTNQQKFRVKNFESDNDYEKCRLVVDTREDMERLEKLVSSMEKDHWEYTFQELVALLPDNEKSNQHP